MKKVIALLITIAMLASIMPMVAFANTKTLDQLIGNELTNGTFESGSFAEWTPTDTTIEWQKQITGNNSAGAIKLTGAGSIKTKESLYAQETYEVSIWAKPVSGTVTVTVTVGDAEAVSKAISDAETISGLVNIGGTSKKGAAINAADKEIVVSVTGACYLDNIIVKESAEKIINAVDNSLGGWSNTGSNGTVEYDATMGAVKLTDSYNARIVQYIAVEKDAKYTISADIYIEKIDEAVNKALRIYWGESSYSGKDPAVVTLPYITKADCYQKWDTFTTTVTSPYPTSGEKAGIYFSIGANGSSAKATFYLKNVHVTKITDTVARPEITLTATGDRTIVPTCAPTNVDDGTDVYYMYRYTLDGVAYETGFATSVPPYQVAEDFVGTVSLAVTPVIQGACGITETIERTYAPQVYDNAGVADLDAAIGNKLLKGTFENDMPGSDWTLNGVTLTKETEYVCGDASFTAAKVSGDGTIVIKPTIYANQLFDVALSAKAVNEEVTVTLSADFGSDETTKTIFTGTVTKNGWTNFSEQLIRYDGTFKNAAAKAVTPTLTLSVDGDCYIDEFTLIPSENMLVTRNGVRICGSDVITEVGGWIQRGTDITLSDNNGVLTAKGLYTADHAPAQYVVYEKGANYRLTADIQLVEESTNNKGKAYLIYNSSPQNFTLPTEETTMTWDIDTSAIAHDVMASGVMLTGQGSSSKADMYIKNASLVKVKNFTQPAVKEVALPLSAVEGSNLTGEAVSYFEQGDSVGYLYRYQLGSKTIVSGYAINNDIPSIKLPQPEGGTGTLTLTVIPVNSEGAYGTAATATCTVKSNFVVIEPTVDKETLKANQTVSMTVQVENNSGKTENMIAIAAYYEGDTMLKCACVQKDVTTLKPEDFALSFQLPATCQGGGKLRVYVWKGYDRDIFLMEPVVNAINPVQ